eukprot:CAMPEP_0170528844 /NCGR_PEP_ID=MMETSP0209-20121228/14284_1 /TAXON_ID=665100 ORGANISM="Litonotus pictus, Strain P1" /NCGR_SAMPLE_ID=MMETSP0209 /ASSEMBLY_ACC=CAM_ASM_000301 /LENGTH=91 /DNA_ID=CAMNT_0010820255 /DNA_START=321 /DNA_END=596 /DNA_ORIENTATION=+
MNYLSFDPLINGVLSVKPLSWFVFELGVIIRNNSLIGQNLAFIEVVPAPEDILDGGDILVHRFEGVTDIEGVGWPSPASSGSDDWYLYHIR